MKEYIGKQLVLMHDNLGSITLGFSDDSSIRFEGLIFRSMLPVIGCTVRYIEKTEVLGFKGITHLRYIGKDIEAYNQLFIEFDGSVPEWKRELICIIKKDSFRYDVK
jgi:hypothetical protein